MAKELGFLWLMDMKMGLEANLRLAMAHHVERFGTVATVCNANPDDLKDEVVVVDGVRILPVKGCLKEHLFVGRKI